MNAIEVRQYMSEAWKIRKELRAKLNAMEELRSLAEKTTASYSLTPGGQSEGSSKVENYAIRIVEMQQDMDDCIDNLWKHQREVQRLIEMASDPIQRAILTEYHLNGKKCEVVADEVGYSDRHVRYLMDLAYKEIASKT